MIKKGAFHSIIALCVVAGIMVTTSFRSAPGLSLREVSDTVNSVKKGVFTCVINDKPFVIEGITASMRNITGGERQLSLSNDRFVKFSFLNPSEKMIDLSKKSREAYIRYEDPATRMVAQPSQGYVKIKTIDEKRGVISGDFEIELVIQDRDKKRIIKVTKGKMIDIPIVFK